MAQFSVPHENKCENLFRSLETVPPNHTATYSKDQYPSDMGHLWLTRLD